MQGDIIGGLNNPNKEMVHVSVIIPGSSLWAKILDNPEAWIWAPSLGEYEGKLDNLRPIDQEKERYVVLLLQGQFRPIYQYQDKLWADPKDIEAVKQRPVILAFAPPIESKTYMHEDLLLCNVSELLPPPQWGTIGIVNPGTPKLTYYVADEISADVPAIKETQTKIHQLLENSVIPWNWSIIDDFVIANIMEENIGLIKASLRQKLFTAQSQKERDGIQKEIDQLVRSVKHYDNMMTRRRWIDNHPDEWDKQIQEFYQLTQTLVNMYWEVHQLVSSKKILPNIPDVRQNNGLLILTDQTTLTALEAISAARNVSKNNPGKWPMTAIGKNKYPTYQRNTQTSQTAVQYREELNEITSVTKNDDDIVDKLLTQVGRLKDSYGDILIAIIAQWIGAPHDNKGVWIHSGQILEYLGREPIKDKKGVKHGWREEDYIEIAEGMNALLKLWIILDQQIREEETGKGNKKKFRPVRYKHESQLINVPEVIRRDELITDMPDGTLQSYPVSWLVNLGTWAEPYLKWPNRQTGYIAQQILKYHGYNRIWEKRIGRYVFFHFRFNNYRAITRDIGVIINDVTLRSEEEEKKNPERARRRFESALERLEADGVIDGWFYQETKNHTCVTPPRQWFTTWLDKKITIFKNPDKPLAKPGEEK
jgi:hypothetical protein